MGDPMTLAATKVATVRDPVRRGLLANLVGHDQWTGRPSSRFSTSSTRRSKHAG